MTKAEIAAMLLENAALKAEANKRTAPAIRLKVSEKGGVSVYGLGRFPLTLYRGQWERLLPLAGAITEFIAENAESLAVKGE
jgi:hypothetical protein